MAGLLDYIRNGFNDAINNSPANPFRPANQALDYANKVDQAANPPKRDDGAAAELARLQKQGQPTDPNLARSWQERVLSLKMHLQATSK